MLAFFLFSIFTALIQIVAFLVSTAVWLAATAFMVWMIIDCVKHEPRDGNDRLIWTIITVFVPYLGALVYYVVRRPERMLLFASGGGGGGARHCGSSGSPGSGN